MPNSRHTSAIASPSNRRATKRRRSSITELAFHGIHTSRRTKAESVTHVSGTFCHLCLGPLSLDADRHDNSLILLTLEGSCFGADLHLSYAAQYLACALPCERFTSALADNLCTTRGRYGSLRLHRDGLRPSTF